MNIIQWNIQGIFAKKQFLKILMKEYNPICFALQELNFGNDVHTIDKEKYSFSKYKTFHSMVVGRLGAGILIREDIPARPISLRTDLQAVAVRIQPNKTTENPSNKAYTICSIYIPPRSHPPLKEIKDLLDQLPKPIILLGDFNSRDRLWGDTITTHIAATIKTVMRKCDLELMNNGDHTHYNIPTGTTTAIDLSLISPESLMDFEWRVIDGDTPLCYESDHFPILLESTNGPPTEEWERFNFNKANWKQYEQLTEIKKEQYEDSDSIEGLVELITTTMLFAAERAIPRSRGTTKTSLPWWNEEVADVVQRRKSASRRYHRTKNKQDKEEYRELDFATIHIMNEAAKNSWQSFTSTVNSETPTSKVWKAAGRMEGKHKRNNPPIIIKNGKEAESLEESADFLAQTYEDISSGGSFPAEYRRAKERVEAKPLNFEEGDDKKDYNIDFLPSDMEGALSHCKNSAAGPDGITYFMIMHSHYTLLQCLLYLYNKIWNNHEIPSTWKEATIIPILKPNKCATEPKNYRPISLTSCLGKLLEKMVAIRLTKILEDNNLANEQYGFRRAYSTMQPLLKLYSYILDAFANKEVVVAVFFDIKGAYDTTWRRGTIEEIHRMGIRGNLAYFLLEFLSNRTFRVKMGNILSNLFELMEGVPQGGVLSCLLFAIAINGMLSVIPPHILKSLFVDDLSIALKSRCARSAIRRMQPVIDKIVTWANKNGYEFSTEKTKFIIFNKKRKKIDPGILPEIKKQPISRVTNHRFLGVTFNERLNWSQHITQLHRSCQKPLTLLNHLSHTTYGADRKTLTLLYGALVQSKLDYAVLLYGSAPKTLLKKLDSIRNSGLRYATGAFRTSPIDSLDVETNTLPAEDHRALVSFKWYLQLLQRQDQCPIPSFLKLERNENPLITNSRLHQRLKEIKEFIGDIQISPVKFEPPPWKIPKIEVCKINGKKKDYEPYELKEQFREHCSIKHPDCIELYTDASKTKDGVGAAVVVPSKSMSDDARLNKHQTIYSAELTAIILALNLINVCPWTDEKYVIFTDSLSAIKAIPSYNPKHPLLREIQEWLVRMHSRKKIEFCWVPGHSGIQGNELADVTAKKATNSNKPIKNHSIYHKDIVPVVKYFLRSRWQQRWDREPFNKLRRIKPKIQKWDSSFQRCRRDEVTLCRLRIGHTRFSKLYLIEKERPPVCHLCAGRDRPVETLDVAHIFSRCEGSLRARRRFFPESLELDESDRLSSILKDSNTFDMEKIIKFVSELDLLNRI